MSERRASPRSAAAVPVKVSFGSAADFVRAYTEDVSLGGVFIATTTKIPEGTLVDLTVALGGGKGIRAIAKVVRFREAASGKPAGVGLQFVRMHTAHQEWLQAAVKKFGGPPASAQAAGSKPAQGAAAQEQQGQQEGGEDEVIDLNREHLLRRAEGGDALEQSLEDLNDLDIASSGDPVLGIDLGTSNCAACLIQDGNPTFVDFTDPDFGPQQTNVLPSIISFDDDGNAKVGRRAIEGLRSNARRTVFGSKRFIGRDYDSPIVQDMLTRFPYKIAPSRNGRVGVQINARAMNLSSVASKILDTIREKAVAQFGGSIERAIITVPAYYNNNQRDAVVQAGRLAGLAVERIVNEPTAAAIAYGLHRTKPRRLIVYDLGGGTFDVSVMNVFKDSLRVLATAGDTFLGGEDFDDVIVAFVMHEVKRRTKKEVARNHAVRAMLKFAAMEAKVRLTNTDKTSVVARDVLMSDGSKQRVEVPLDRKQLEALVKPLVDRTLKICDMAVSQAQLNKSDIGDVILVGGQVRMPYVKQRVGEHFKVKPRSELNPDTVVAQGAAKLAELGQKGDEMFQDALSMTIGVGVGTRFKKLIPRNTSVPCVKSFPLHVPKKRFDTYSIDVWQGESDELARNEKLGAIPANAVSPGRKDPVPLKVDFVLSPDCLLKVRVTNRETEESQHVLLQTKDSG